MMIITIDDSSNKCNDHGNGQYGDGDNNDNDNDVISDND